VQIDGEKNGEGAYMRTVTLDQATRDLKSIIKKTIRDHDETVIASDEGAVVVLEENEWSNIKETLRLLSDRKSLIALLESHTIRDKGKNPESVTVEEAFNDI
jgi:PHD/YefM family antitoxin component YafN of YafNO toxin-antitoxin module